MIVVMVSVAILSVIILGVIMLSVVAPFIQLLTLRNTLVHANEKFTHSTIQALV
jgi:hypothetical protein